MERPGHLGQISKGVGRPVIWRCSDRPLLWLSLSLVLLPFSLPPSTASHPQDLSRCCQLPAQLYTQDQPGDRVDGEDDIKKECKKKREILRCKPGLSSCSKQYKRSISMNSNVFFLLPHKENLRRSNPFTRYRETERERERKEE